MNRIYLLAFIMLLGCTSSNRVYICGDHECINKKEIEDYFKNNISMEVYVVESNKSKKKNQDLVQLNILKDKKVDKKKEELVFLKKRKQEITKTKKEQKPSKLKLKVETEKKEKPKKAKNKMGSAKSKTTFAYKKQKSTKIVHMCKRMEECDIDIISKKVNDLGKGKSFPNINF